MLMNARLILIILLVVCSPAPAVAGDGYPDPLGPKDIDRLTERAMDAFGVPGMAVGVVHDGEVRYAAGHGVREAGRPGAVDTRTLFRIASATKAFTAAAAAVLVDEGRVSWNGPITDHLPELRMSDPWVTANLSLVDLLAHRSGLSPHAGDLLLWPVPNAFTEADIIHALRYFPLDAGFRNGYTYDNVLYIVAGEMIARVSGRTWGEFVDQRIMATLDMDRCFAGAIPPAQMRNLAAPHGTEDDGSLWIVERNRIPAAPSKFSPAGGIACSLDDMLKWVLALLAGGGTAADDTVFSATQARTMWTPHNWLGVGETTRALHDTHFRAYGLGWRLQDVHGVLEVSHTGSLDGWRAQVVMVPELALGIVVLANGSSSAARNAVSTTIEYGYLPVQGRDWVQWYLDEQEAPSPAPDEDEPASPDTSLRLPARPMATYTGRFRDPWFGDIVITREDGGLRFRAEKAPKLTGPLTHRSGDLFLARWDDREIDMDAWVRFVFDPDDRVAGVSMNRHFEDGDGLDHFKHLDFEPVIDE